MVHGFSFSLKIVMITRSTSFSSSKQWKISIPSGSIQEHKNSWTRRNMTDQIVDETRLFCEYIVIINHRGLSSLAFMDLISGRPSGPPHFHMETDDRYKVTYGVRIVINNRLWKSQRPKSFLWIFEAQLISNEKGSNFRMGYIRMLLFSAAWRLV